MKELEKILEEIRVKAIELKNTYWADDERHLTGKGVEAMCVQAEQVIRKRMKDGWIPVGERLPGENQEVWITTKYGEVKRAMYTEHLGNNEVKIFLLIGGTENIEEVSAWQPYYVPEPYMPEND